MVQLKFQDAENRRKGQVREVKSQLICTVERQQELTQESVGASGLKVRTVESYQFCLLERVVLQSLLLLGMRQGIVLQVIYFFQSLVLFK